MTFFSRRQIGREMIDTKFSIENNATITYIHIGTTYGLEGLSNKGVIFKIPTLNVYVSKGQVLAHGL